MLLRLKILIMMSDVFKTLGIGPFLNILFVVHCERSKNRIRIISARKADRNETKQYFQGLSHE